MSPCGYMSSAGWCSVRRRPTGPDIVRVHRAPVAQGIERCPAEAEVACSIHAGRTSRHRSSRRRLVAHEAAPYTRRMLVAAYFGLVGVLFFLHWWRSDPAFDATDTMT